MRVSTITLQPAGKYWVVETPYMAVYKHPEHPRLFVNIPQGFKTNLDSVPRIPIIYTWLKNRTMAAAAIHDWMYMHSSRFTQKMADDYFLLLMELEGVRARYRYPIYWGVRLFGASYRK